MNTFLLIVHFLACFLLIVAVLLQNGKGSAAGVFGGGGNSDAIFAASSSMDFIKKFTMGCALTIAITSVLLTVYASRLGSSSVVNKYRFQQPAQTTTPVTPAQPAPAK
jgi:preprotein translocase subunit SecG